MRNRKITVDTSIPMAVLLNEPSKQLLLDFTRNATLISAPILPWEIGNALTALLKRGRIDLEQARLAFESFNRIPVQLVPIEIASAVEAAARWNLYAYDAYVIECAKAHQAPLLSLDRRQCEAAAQEGVTVLEVPE